MPTVTIHATPPTTNPALQDETHATAAHQYAVQAQSAAVSAGQSRDAIEAILEEVEIGAAFISKDENNRLKRGGDGGYFVHNDFTPDPLAHYILAKG